MSVHIAFDTPQDIKDVGLDVLRHRVIGSYEAEAEEKTSEDIITTILEQVRVPCSRLHGGSHDSH